MTNKEIEKFWQEKYEQGCLVLNGTQKLAIYPGELGIVIAQQDNTIPSESTFSFISIDIEDVKTIVGALLDAVTAESVRLHQLDIDIEKWESHLKDKV